ncbi:DUF6049 family protein [Demequina sp.]|uniref:DUF6049 family protein n=1 Tax=Demequina sp. TaxID=2050685 RepID=UPI003D0EEE45
MIRRLLVVAALAVLGLAGATSASTAEGEPSITLTEYGPAVLTATDTLTVGATVANPTTETITTVNATISITTKPLTTSSALSQFLANPVAVETTEAASTPVLFSTPGGPVNLLPAGGVSKVSLSAGATALGLPADTAGVYGVVIALQSADGVLAYQTAALTWYDAEITALPVSVVVTASGSQERVAQVLAAASDSRATVQLDPATITDSTQADALATQRELFGVPTWNPDLTSIAHGEDRTLLDFAIADANTNSLPALQSLPWLATLSVVDQATVELAASRGAVAGLLNVAGGATLGASAPVVDVRAGDTTLPVLVPNGALSTLLATYHPGMPDASARLVAEAALIAAHSDGETPVVVAPGASWQVPTMGESAALADLLNAPFVTPVTLQSVIDGADRGSFEAPELRGAKDDLGPDLINALALQLEEVKQLSVTAENPADIYVPGGRTLLQPLASNLRADPDARSTTYQASRDAANELLSSLHVAVGSDVNLIAASGNVPVTLRNDLGVDATVTVVMRSTSPNLVVQDQPVVTIPAGSDLTVHIPVTGVKSANVTTTVALRNADGDVVAAPQALKVRVRADWGNAITVVFVVGLALLLVAGVVRTVRRGRRSSRMAPMEPPVPEGNTDAGGKDG